MPETESPTRTRPNGASVTSRARAIVANEARHMVEERGLHERAAERLDQVRQSVPQTDGRIGSYLGDFSTRMERVSERLRQGDYRGSGQEIRSLAKDHPEVFIGAAFMAGALVGRVAREVMAEQQREGTPNAGRSTTEDRNDTGPNARTAPPPETPLHTPAGGPVGMSREERQ